MPQQEKDRSTGVLAALLAMIVIAMTILGARVLGAQAAPERGAFIVRVNGDTAIIERFTRFADSLQGSVTVKGQLRSDFVAETGPGHTVRSISFAFFPANAKADDAPIGRARITMRGDSAIADVNGATQRLGTKAGAIPWINGSFVLLELATGRMRSAGGAPEVPLFLVSGGATLPVTSRAIGADSVILVLGGQEQRLRVDATGRILGGTAGGAQKVDIIRVGASVASTLKFGRPDYSPPAGAPYIAEEVSLPGPGGITLGGTLTIPKGATAPLPAIVTITGSGQQDRDELIPVAGGYRPFRQIADTLGRRGIAVLRLDDRTIGASGGAVGTTADYADDIRAGLAYLRTRSDIDGNRLGLVGHSEGGAIGPLVASTDARLKGMVVLAGPAYTGAEIIRFQLRNLVDHDTSVAMAKKDSGYRALQAKFDAAAGKDVWTRFFLTYDPIPTAKRVKVPTLILQGRTDQQVTYEQAEKLGAAIKSGGNSDVTVRVFPDLNHLFIHDTDGSPTEYVKLPTNKMSSEVLGAIADWLAMKLSATASKATP